MGVGAEAALDVVLRLRNEAAAGISQFRSQLQGISTGALAVGGALTAGVTVPLVAIAREAINTAASFESQMNILGMAARSSGTSMTDLSKAAQLVGADTQLVGINSSQAAIAMTNFYKAGLDTSEIFSNLNGYLETGTGLQGALRAAIDLTAASELGLDQASMLVASSMATFGLTADDATRISNSFVGAADASLASVAGLAQGMANIGPTAAAFGWSIEETNTALALLSTRGIEGAEAGTALKSMMLNLMAPTADNTAALKALNVSLYDAKGNMLPLPAIIGQLTSAMAGMTEEERLNTIQTLAGSYGQKAMNTLLAEGVPGWDNMAAAVAAAATAQEVAAARTQGLSAAWEQLKGALETVYINVGLPLIQNFLTPLVQRITAIISSVLDMNPQLRNAALAFGAVLAVAGPLLLAIGGVTGALSLMLGPLTAVIGPVLAIVAAVALLAAAWASDFLGMRTKLTEWWGDVQPKLAAAATKIRDGIGQAVKDVSAWFTEHWAIMKTAVIDWWGTTQPKLKEAYDDIRDKVGQAVKDVSGWWAEYWPKMKKAVTDWWSETQPKFKAAYDDIRDKVGQVIKDVSGWWAEHWPKMQAAVLAWWGAIQPKFADAYADIRGKVGQAVKDVSAWWTTEFPKMKIVLATFVSSVETGARTIISWLGSGGLQRTVADIKSKWQDFADKAKAAWDALVKFFEPTVKRIMTGLGDLQITLKPVGPAFTAALEAGKTAFQTFWKAAEPILRSLASVVGIVVAVVVKLLGETLAAALQNIGKVAEGALKIITGAFTVAEGIIKGVVAVVKALLDGDFSKAWEAAKKTVADVAKGFGTAIEGAGKVIDGALGTIWDAVTNLAKDLLGTNLPLWEEFKEGVGQVFVLLWQAITQTMLDVWTAITTTVENVKTWIANFSLFDVGVALIQGLIGGVVSMAKALVSAAVGVVQGAINAAKALLGIHSPSTVFAEIGQQMIAGLIAGVDDEKAEAALKVAEAVSGIIQAAIDTVQRLQDYEDVHGLTGALNNIAHWLRVAVEIVGGIGKLVKEDLQEAAKTFADNAGPAVDVFGGAMETLQKLAEWQDLHGLTPALNNIAHWLRVTVEIIGGIGKLVGEDLQEAAKTFAENAGPVVELIGGAIESLLLLGGAAEKLAALSSLSAEITAAMQQLAAFLGELVRQFGIAGTVLTGELQTAASTFATNAGPVTDVIEGAITAITAFSEYVPVPDLDALGASMNQVRDFLLELMRQFMVAGMVLTGELQTAAKTFAENAGPVTDVIEGAITAITAISGYIPVPDLNALGIAMNQIRDFLLELVRQFAVAGMVLTGELQTSASTFATNAGPVLDLVEGAITAITAFSKYVPIPDINALTTAMGQIADFLRRLVDQIGYFGLLVSSELQTSASTFATNAKPVLDIVNDAITTIMAFSKYIPIPDINALTTAMGQIADFTRRLVDQIGYFGLLVTGELQTSASTFATNAKPVLDIVKSALDAITTVSNYVPVPNINALTTAMGQIAAFVKLLIEKFGEIGGQISGDLQKAAMTFANSAGVVTGSVKSAVEALNALNDYLGVDTEMVDVFVADVAYVVTRVAEAAGTISADGLKAASDFAVAAKDVADMVKTGNLALVGEGGVQYYHDVSNATIDLFVEDMTYVLDQILLVAGKYTSAGLAKARELADAMAEIGTALNKGVSGLIKPQGTAGVTISDYTAIAHTVFDTFLADMTYVVDKVEEAAGDFTLRGLYQAMRFAETGAAIFAAITSGIKMAVGIGKTTTDEVDNFRYDMDAIISIIESAVAAIQVLKSSIYSGAYSSGLSFMENLANGLEAGLTYVEAALAALAALFPHSPAKEGPLSKLPDWNAYLLGGLDSAAASVARTLSGIGGGGLSVAPVGGGGGVSVAPIARAGGGGGLTFVYAPTVSMASQREAQEAIAPVIAEVLRREARRG